MRTYVGTAALDSDGLAADRAWVRWGMAVAVTGMLAWLAGFALIPLDAKLDKGEQHLVQVLQAHTGQLYAAACTPASPNDAPMATMVWVITHPARDTRSKPQPG